MILLRMKTELSVKNKKMRTAAGVFVLLLAVFLFPVRLRAEEPRSLTLMIYMCGSNLESRYGSATADLQEIAASGYDTDKTTVLVMAGGSSSWNLSLNPEEISISEFGRRGSRIVWHEEARDMGDPETLTGFLQYGTENYPARDYALILWDHGGGPMEGVCWDELFSMDHLSLSELTEALEASALPGKLRWIGFDACLMGSVEVAEAVSPYADYMIASQETEPARGWNYAFLKGIESDGSGAETGRRIIDCFFEDLEDSGDILTLSCVDLSAVREVVDCMDGFFMPISQQLDEEKFAGLSGLRMASTGFGRSVRGPQDSYDLVDLKDLVTRYETMPEGGVSEENDEEQDHGRGGALLSAISGAVVCSRSTEESVGGLSVYHPYANKEKYIASWRKEYRNLDFCSGYQKYLEMFGSLLTAELMADWRGLPVSYPGVDENGVHHLSLALTEEQQENLVSAQLLILWGHSDHQEGKPMFLLPVSAEPVSLEKGVLSAEYGGRSVFVLDDEGKTLDGPIPFFYSEEDDLYTFGVVYRDDSGRKKSKGMEAVDYLCALHDETGELEIVRTYVHDEATDTYTNRIPFTEEGYTHLAFWTFPKVKPEAEEPLPGFDDWENALGVTGELDLSRGWHLHMFPDKDILLGNGQLYASFQITDVQQNTCSTAPVLLTDPHRKELDLTPASMDLEDVSLTMSAVQKLSEEGPRIEIGLDITNRSGKMMDYMTTKLVLNGNRMTSGGLYLYSSEDGQEGHASYTIRDDDLLNMDEIRSIDCTLKVKETGGYDSEAGEIPLHFEVGNGTLSGVREIPEKAICEACQDGITWELLSLEWDPQGALNGLMRIRNDTEEEVWDGGCVLVNGIRSDDHYYIDWMYPHTEKYYHFTMENRAVLSSEIRIDGAYTSYALGMPDVLQKAGIEAIDRIELVNLDDREGTVRRKVCLELGEPLPVPKAEEEFPERIMLMDGDVCAELESVVVGDDGIGLALRFVNRTDEIRVIRIDDPIADETPLSRSEYDFVSTSVALLPGTEAYMCRSLDNSDVLIPGLELKELDFCFLIDEEKREPVRIRFPEGTVFGASGGSYFDAGDLMY